MVAAHVHHASLETQISQWRTYLRRRQAIHTSDLSELEDHLRAQVDDLVAVGLSTDEAFLVAVRRMGDLDAISREFAHEHSERLWHQLVTRPADGEDGPMVAHTNAVVAVCLALAAAAAIKVPALFGMHLDQDAGIYARNLSFFVLPLLCVYFVWRRGHGSLVRFCLVAAFVAAGVFANVYPFASGGSTEVLTTLHLPIALWWVVGLAYAGGRWRQASGRMDFIRFSGEVFIYFVLIALGCGVLVGFTALTFQSIGVDIEPFFASWLLPCGGVGAVVIAAWLVEAKQSVIENMAPVLTRLFTPLLTLMLVTFLATLAWSGRGVDVEREVLIAFDLLLILVLSLLVYSISARDPRSPPDPFDAMQAVLLVSALLADAVALWAIAARITDFGFSPNRVAAAGVNVVLLANLAWATVLQVRFLTGRGPFADIERWQTDYLHVYAAWAVIVVVVFPPAFGHI